jgi:hypothetical protein
MLLQVVGNWWESMGHALHVIKVDTHFASGDFSTISNVQHAI